MLVAVQVMGSVKCAAQALLGLVNNCIKKLLLLIVKKIMPYIDLGYL